MQRAGIGKHGTVSRDLGAKRLEPCAQIAKVGRCAELRIRRLEGCDSFRMALV